MTDVAECFAWCIVQVTLLAGAALAVYALVRRRNPTRNVWLLSGSLATVFVLTITCWSPWPTWRFTTRRAADQRAEHIPARIESALPNTVTSPQRLPDQNRPIDVAEVETWQAIEPTGKFEAFRANVPGRRIAIIAALSLAAIGVARFLVGLLFVRRYRRKSAPIDDAELHHAFDQLRQQLEIARPVELREAPSLGVAATLGWRRPMVLLPAEWQGWSADERRAVLAHELAHVAQRHFPQWLVGQLAIAPHFYHPLVHWLGRRLRLEQELAADQLAAQVFGSRRRYTNTLTELALGPLQPAAAFAGLGLFMSRPLLMRRIAMLRKPLDDTRDRSNLGRNVGFSVLLLAAVVAAGFRASSEVAAANGDSTAAEPIPDSTISPTPEPYGSVRVMPTSAKSGAVREVTALVQVSNELFPDQRAGAQSWRVYSRTQAALLGSKFVMQAALRKTETANLPLVAAQDDPLHWLHSRLFVGFIPDSEIMYVSMKGDADEVEQMRKIVDSVVQAYLDECVLAEKQRQSVTRDALAKSLTQLSDEISRKMKQYLDLSRELGIQAHAGQRDPETELLLREIVEATRAKRELELKLLQIQQDYMIMRQRSEDRLMADAAIDEKLKSDPVMSVVNQRLILKQSELAQQRSSSKEDTQETYRLEKQIAQVQKQIDRYRAELKQQMLESQKLQPDRELQLLTKEYQISAEMLNAQIQALDKSITEKTEKLMTRSERSVDVEVFETELQQLQEIARDMSVKLEMMDVHSAMPGRVRVIQWAM